MRFIVSVIALIGLLSGCVSYYSTYDESISEVRVSSDLKTLWVTGSGKYSYELDIPEPLSQVIDSPLKNGMHLMFQGFSSFTVKEDGTVSGSFKVIVPDAFLQDRDDLKQKTEDIGFLHGQTYRIGDWVNVVPDDDPILESASESAADRREDVHILDDVYFLPVSMSGHRFNRKKMVMKQDADLQKLDQRYAFAIHDDQVKQVNLVLPALLAGTGVLCIDIWPVCLTAALLGPAVKP